MQVRAARRAMQGHGSLTFTNTESNIQDQHHFISAVAAINDEYRQVKG